MTRIKKIFSGIFAGIFALFIGLGTVQAQENVVDVVNESEDHTVFAELLNETELDVILEDEGPYTVLAPTDEAFEEVEDKVEELKENPEELQNVVIGHLYQGNLTSDEVEGNIDVTIESGDIEAPNGTVHSISEVLIE